MKRILSILLATLLVALTFGTKTILADKPVDFDEKTGAVIKVVGDQGFDQWGYNRTARIFSGTGLSWCMEQGASQASCTTSLTDGTTYYGNDKLIMKWNAEWDRGNAENWTSASYNAWSDNEWNGMAPGGSNETWHYKFVWVGPCADGTPLPNGGYCIWGQFAVIMSHGTYGGAHFWYTLAQPAGYGTYP
jgi:hypothetical protein